MAAFPGTFADDVIGQAAQIQFEAFLRRAERVASLVGTPPLPAIGSAKDLARNVVRRGRGLSRSMGDIGAFVV